jgi:outer membrane murein-binding lipoprotein Lpp
MGLKVTAVLGAVMLAIVAGFYWYYQDSQARIQTLSENNAKLETAVDMNEQTIDILQEDYEQTRQELRRVNEEFSNIRNQNSVLAEKLERHDLGVLGNAKPGLVERIVDSATDETNRCFEILSGAELTEEERNADTAEKANSQCPWLFGSSTAD